MLLRIIDILKIIIYNELKYYSKERIKLELKGELAEIIYQNEVNSYTVATLETDEEEFTIVGYLPFINIGDTLKLIGRFVTHQDYGRQFKVETFEKMMPQSLASLERYLGNGTIKGIGPATAKKIIDKFGEQTIHIFKFEPTKLARDKRYNRIQGYRNGRTI